MENSAPNNSSNYGKRILRRNSNSHISMSDTESTTSHVDSWHSPLGFDSPLRSDDPFLQPENDNPNNKNSKSLVAVDKYYSPVPSPTGKSNLPASSPAAGVRGWRPWPHSETQSADNLDFPPNRGKKEKQGQENHNFAANGTSPVILGLNRFVRDELPQGVKKVGPVDGDGEDDEVGGERRSRAAVASILKRSERSVAVSRLALVLRVFELMACLISFAVMAADKTQGWSGDSFDRYKEYRYCLAVNVVGFVYAGFQAFGLACNLGTGKHVISHNLRYHFDFSLDQILAYLLLSASSSAATRVDDWISNWGKDQFTIMASSSIAMSFLAFIAFASSSLISGYNLCNREST